MRKKRPQIILAAVQMVRCYSIIEALNESCYMGNAPVDVIAFLLVLLNRLHSLLDLERDFDDLAHAAQCNICYFALARLAATTIIFKTMRRIGIRC
jgi:hypothetical protein